MDPIFKLFIVIREIINFYNILMRESNEALHIELHQIIDQLKGILTQLNRVLEEGSNGVPLLPTYSRAWNLRILFPREEEIRASSLIEPDSGETVVTTIARVRVQARCDCTEIGSLPVVGENEYLEPDSDSDVPDLIDSEGNIVI